MEWDQSHLIDQEKLRILLLLIWLLRWILDLSKLVLHLEQIESQNTINSLELKNILELMLNMESNFEWYDYEKKVWYESGFFL